jgi:putative hydrolase of the HAD superfamily
MAVSTILFDGGGILIDESSIEQAIADTITGILKRFVPTYTVEQYWLDTEEAVYRFAPSTYRYVIWKNTQDAVIYERLYAIYLEQISEKRPPLRLTAGIDAELRKLRKRFRFGIAGQYGGEILGTLRQGEILDLFDNRVTQDDFRITKPDPRYFEQIAAACGVSPAECVMVGDRIDNDVIPAKQVGMWSVRYRTGIHQKQEARTPSELPDVEITSISQLAEAIFHLTINQ